MAANPREHQRNGVWLPTTQDVVASVSPAVPPPVEQKVIEFRQKLTPASLAFEELETAMAGGNEVTGAAGVYNAIDLRVSKSMDILERAYPATMHGLRALDATAARKWDSGSKKITINEKEANRINAAYANEMRGESVVQPWVDSTIWPRGWPIDWRIYIMMELAEWYITIDGDLWQALTAPIDIGRKAISIRVKGNAKDASAIKNKIQALFDAVNIDEVLEETWLCNEIYGNAFPVTIWDRREGKPYPKSIVNVDPKFISVGRYALGNNAYEMIVPDRSTFDEMLYRQKTPDLFVNSLAPHWNEFWTRGRGLYIGPDSIYHIHTKKAPFQRYGIPPLARAFRTISTRQQLDEMIRATIEGVRNQLWVVSQRGGPPDEIARLTGIINGSVGARTGLLVVKEYEPDGFKINQYVPGVVDELMGLETRAYLTQSTFRQMGISVRLISGESPGFVGAPGGGGGGGGGEIDITLLIERIQYQRELLIRFLYHYLGACAVRMKDEKLESALRNGNVTLKFGDTIFQIEKNVKLKLAPLAAFGFLSIETMLESVGEDYETELDRRKNEKAGGALDVFKPYEQFKQTAIGKDGGESSTSQSGNSFGREPNATNPGKQAD